MSLRSSGAKRPLRCRSAATTSATSNGAAFADSQPNGTTAIGTAFSWPRVISITSWALAMGATNAAMASSASDRTRFSILFLRISIFTSIVLRLEHEHQVPLEHPRIRRRRQRRGLEHRGFDRLLHRCIAVALVDLRGQHCAARGLRDSNRTFQPGPRRGRAVPVAHDGLLDHCDVLIQQPGICSLVPTLFLCYLTLQIRFALLLQLGIVSSFAAFGFFLLLAFDLGDAFLFRLGLALTIRLGLGLALCFLLFARLLFFGLATLLLDLALLLLLLTLFLGTLLRVAFFLLPALLRLLPFAFLLLLALLLARGTVDHGPVDDHGLDRQRRLQRLAPDVDHREPEHGSESEVQQHRPDQVNPVFADELRHRRSALGPPLRVDRVGDEADLL